MKNYQNYFITLVFCLIILSSCSSNDETNSSTIKKDKSSIILGVDFSKLYDIDCNWVENYMNTSSINCSEYLGNSCICEFNNINFAKIIYGKTNETNLIMMISCNNQKFYTFNEENLKLCHSEIYNKLYPTELTKDGYTIKITDIKKIPSTDDRNPQSLKFIDNVSESIQDEANALYVKYINSLSSLYRDDVSYKQLMNKYGKYLEKNLEVSFNVKSDEAFFDYWTIHLFNPKTNKFVWSLRGSPGSGMTINRNEIGGASSEFIDISEESEDFYVVIFGMTQRGLSTASLDSFCERNENGIDTCDLNKVKNTSNIFIIKINRNLVLNY